MATNAVIQTVGAAGYVSLRVTQTGHGLTGRVPVYYNTSTNLWTAARANAGNTLGTHLAKVIDSNTLLIVQSGIFPDPTHGLTAGQYYFVSDSVAGTLTVTEPTAVGSFSNPVLYVTDANTYIVLGYRSSQTVNQSFNPLLNDGTAAAPSLAFSADPDTGLYRIGANTMGIATNGTRVGEIGIGYGGFTGNIIQVVNTKFTSYVSITAAVNNTLRTTGIVGSITTKLANSKILIFINCSGIVNNLSNYMYSIIYRNTSTWSSNVAPVGTSLVVKHVLAATPVVTSSAMSFPSYMQMDDPLQPAGTTLFYGDSMSNNGSGSTIEINYDPAGFSASRAYASITLMEIMV